MNTLGSLIAFQRRCVGTIPASLPLTLARLVAAGLGFLSTMVLAPVLGPAALGIYALALNVQGWSQHVAELGLRTAVTAAAARCGSARDLVAPYLLARLATTTITLLVLSGATMLLAAEALPVILVVSLSLVAMALQLDWVALVAGCPVRASIPLVVRPALFLAGIAVTAVLAPRGLDALAAAALFSLSWTGACVVSWMGAGPIAWRAPVERVAALLRAGPPLAGNSLLNQALVGIDLWVVAHVAGLAAVGPYFLAAQIATAGTVTANAVGQARLARPGAAGGSADGLVAVAWLGASIATALIALAPTVVEAVLGSGDAPVAGLVVPFALWCALQHLSVPLQSAVTRADRAARLLGAAQAAFATTVVVLAVAAASGSVVIVAWARVIAELVRIALLLAVVPATQRAAVIGAAVMPASLLGIAAVAALC